MNQNTDTTTTASAQPENVRLETQTFEQFKASYISKVESGELYESPHETFERENFSLSFWHKKFYNHI